jgi:hypothetical protein
VEESMVGITLTLEQIRTAPAPVEVRRSCDT